MDIKFDRDNNVCEYFNEKNGSIINVLSNDSGLWFNLNDTFKMFGMIKSSKLWFSKNLNSNEKRWVEFYRNGRKGRELFIPEQKMHELISKIQDDFNENVEFIYGIISDYDMTCINIKDMDLNVEERLAIHALKAESDNFIERSEKYFDVLKGKTELSDYYRCFENKLENEIKSAEAKYDNEKCPEDLRREEQERIKLRRLENRSNSCNSLMNEIGDSLDNMLGDLYAFMDRFDEEYTEVDMSDYEENFDNPLLYDDMYVDVCELKENADHVRECIKEREKRANMLMQFIEEVKRQECEK